MLRSSCPECREPKKKDSNRSRCWPQILGLPWRDLQFRGPFLKMFSTEQSGEICGLSGQAVGLCSICASACSRLASAPFLAPTASASTEAAMP
ncbi:MAG: hypothetical protein QOJ51_4865 [Acidobacteriaceae bacterium]|nr:hypothetical protein [Acidobacteriaceae bacterium]